LLEDAVRRGIESANVDYSEITQYAALDSDVMPFIYHSAKKTSSNKAKNHEISKKHKVRKKKAVSNMQEERPKSIRAIELTNKELAEYHAVKGEAVKINEDKYETTMSPKSQQLEENSIWNYSTHSSRETSPIAARNEIKEIREPQRKINSEKATENEEREDKQDKESDKMKEYFEIIQMAVEKETGIAGPDNYLDPDALNARYRENGGYISWGLCGLNKSSLRGFLNDSYVKAREGVEGHEWAFMFVDKKTGKLIGPSNKKFGNAWKYISYNHTNDFAKAQVMYTIDNFYKEVIEFLEDKYGLKEQDLPKEFKALIGSLSINSGPNGAPKIIKIGLGNGSIENLTFAQIIEKITKERTRINKGKLVHKPKASKKEIKGLLKRYNDEGRRARLGCAQ